MAKPVELRSKIIRVMGAELGQYRKPDNSTTPACIVIKDRDNDPPRDWKCTGVAAFIDRTANHAPKALFQGVLDQHAFMVELVQFDRTQALEDAITSLFCGFQRIKIVSRQRQESDFFEQAWVSFPGQDYYLIER
jgi:hypothetical protein